MDQLRDLLVDQLQDLLHAETQLVQALPQMAGSAHNPKLKEAIEKHLKLTQEHVERLRQSFQILGENPAEKQCLAMTALIKDGQKAIQDLKQENELAADLGLIAAAQKVEHYEISGYGTARYLARQINEREVAKLLSHTLGEEESADYLLSEVSKPLLHEATLVDNAGAEPRRAKAQKA